MEHATRRLILTWLATTVIVTIAGLIGYRSLIRVPELAGRTTPETLLQDPAKLYDDPGMIGTAVEISVNRAVAACMEAQGFDYRGPAAVEGLDQTLDPAVDGYGLSTGPDGGRVTLGDGGADRYGRDAYEQALYGTELDGGGTGGCAAVGAAELRDAMATIASLPYSIAQYEVDALAHPSMVSGLAAWSRCMESRGYTAASPEALILDLADRLSTATAEEAIALIDEERRTAVDDFACRQQHLDPAIAEVTEDLAPQFVAANQDHLESLMPPEPASIEDVTVPTDLGTGDVQVTLLWAVGADLDLQVRDPEGYSINYNTRSSPTGGQLDRDANRSCGNLVPEPVENVFWPDGEAPRGTYTVQVTMWSDCSATLPVAFTVIVKVDGRVLINQQRTTEDGTFRVEFDY